MSDLNLSDRAAEVVAEEAAHVGRMSVDPDRRATYVELAATAALGGVRVGQFDALADLLELGLVSGRLRAIHGAAGERAALSLYGRTPRGRDRRGRARDAGVALSSLAGRTLEKVAIDSPAPGRFALELSAGGTRARITLDGRGVTVESVEA